MSGQDGLSGDPLASWNGTPTRDAIVDFVERVTREGGPEFVAEPARVAVFDNDGTLWAEKPMPVELGFILERLAELAEADRTLRDSQPWKAAWDKDLSWFGAAVTQHYQGDDADIGVLMHGIFAAFAGMTVTAYAARARTYLRSSHHPVLGRPLVDCTYLPMVELLRYLTAHGFTTYIASGGNRDFMRTITEALYGVPAERVIGSSAGLTYRQDGDGGEVVYRDELDVFDDGPLKPVRIWSRVGRRPILAAGNANGDVPMLRFAGEPTGAALRLLVDHDDEDREFRYAAGAERAVAQAGQDGWTVVSMRNDWGTVFADVSLQ